MKKTPIVAVTIVALAMGIFGFALSSSFSSVAGFWTAVPASVPDLSAPITPQAMLPGAVATATPTAPVTITPLPSRTAGKNSEPVSGGATPSSSHGVPTGTPHVRGPSGPPPNY